MSVFHNMSMASIISICYISSTHLQLQTKHTHRVHLVSCVVRVGQTMRKYVGTGT